VLSQVSPEAFLEIVAAGARVLLEATGFLADSGFDGPAEIDETRRGQLLPFVRIDARLKPSGAVPRADESLVRSGSGGIRRAGASEAGDDAFRRSFEAVFRHRSE
jgi:hypothetical protein